MPVFAVSDRLNLQDCVNLGLKNNRELYYLNEDVSLRIMALNEQYRKFYPQLSLSYCQTDQVNIDSPDYRQKSLSLSVSQLVYDGSKLSTEIDSERNDIDLNVLENKQKRIDFIFQVVSGYLSILKQEEKINLQKQLMEIQKRELNIAQKKHEVGEATKLDVLEWQIEYNQSAIDEKGMENDLSFGKMSLMKMLCYDPDKSFETAEKLEVNTLPSMEDYNEENVVGEAIESSTDLKKISITINKAKASAVLNNLFLPDITLNLSYTTGVEQIFQPDTSSWSAGINFSFPFFFDVINAGNSYGGSFSGNQKSQEPQVSTTIYQDPGFFREVKQDALSLDKLSFQYRDKEREVKLNVEKNLSDLKYQKEKISMLNERIELGTGKVDIMKRQVRVGEVLLSEYIKAINSLNEMKVQRVESVYDYTTLLVELMKIRGRLSESIVKSMYKGFLTEDWNETNNEKEN